MEFYFNIDDTFVWDDQQWIITHIDVTDEEYPYECYPKEIVDKAKQIVKDGGVIDDYAFVYDNYIDVLDDIYIDCRQCLSEIWIFEIVYESVQKENERLKAEIKKLFELTQQNDYNRGGNINEQI